MGGSERSGLEVFGEYLDLWFDSGADAVVVLSLYLDEAGTDAGSPVMCVSGYLYAHHNKKNLARRWTAIGKRVGVKIFHMKEHRRPNSIALLPGESSADRTVRHSKMMRDLVKAMVKNSTFGVSVSTGQNQTFADVTPPHFKSRFGGAYTLGSLLCISRIALWIKHTRFTGTISYVLEQGHKEQAHLSQVLDILASDKVLSNALRMAGPGKFLPKGGARGLQTADLLAWHMQNFGKLERGHDSNESESVAAMLDAMVERGNIARLNLDTVLQGILPAFERQKRWNAALLRRLMVWNLDANGKFVL